MSALLKEGRAMKKGNELTWAQVVMAANAPVMTKAALVDGRTDVGVLPTGQVVGVIESLPTVADIVGDIVRQADAVLWGWSDPADLTAGSPPARHRFRPAAALRHPAAAGSTPADGSPRTVRDAWDALALGPQGHHE